MNTERLRLVAELWATLNPAERQAFARQCGGGEAAPAMPPCGTANLDGILAQTAPTPSRAASGTLAARIGPSARDACRSWIMTRACPPRRPAAGSPRTPGWCTSTSPAAK